MTIVYEAMRASKAELADTLAKIASGRYDGVALVPGGPGFPMKKRMSRKMMMRLASRALSDLSDETLLRMKTYA